MPGLWLLSRLLGKMSFDNKSIFWAIILSVFGTNLYYYAVDIPSFSHVLSFSTIIAFFYFINRYKENARLSDLIIGSVILGLIILIRPVNIIILPYTLFFFASFSEFITQLKKISITHYLMAFISTVLVVSIQLLIYKVQTGDWVVYSYSNETFDFLHPQLLDFLFSYRKGFFVYTPIFLMFMVLGLYSMFTKSIYKGSVWVATFLIFCYVASSW